MKVQDYEQAVAMTNNYGDTDLDMYKLTTALAGEVGELCNRVKKRKISLESDMAILDEIGDVMWYATALIKHFRGSLAEVLETNKRKVVRRKEEGHTYNLR